jgi:hypothetical protein
MEYTDKKDTQTQRRKDAKTQGGKPQAKKMNRSKQRKQRVEDFARNADFS